jgi:hypothetical protein
MACWIRFRALVRRKRRLLPEKAVRLQPPEPRNNRLTHTKGHDNNI